MDDGAIRVFTSGNTKVLEITQPGEPMVRLVLTARECMRVGLELLEGTAVEPNKVLDTAYHHTISMDLAAAETKQAIGRPKRPFSKQDLLNIELIGIGEEFHAPLEYEESLLHFDGHEKPDYNAE